MSIPEIVVTPPQQAVSIAVVPPTVQVVGIEAGGPGVLVPERIAVPISFVDALAAGERLPGVMLDGDVKFALNFGGSAVTVRGTAPAATAVHVIEKVGPDGSAAQIGTLTVHTDKTCVLASTASGEFVVPAGYAIQMTGPSPEDGLLSNLMGELAGSAA